MIVAVLGAGIASVACAETAPKEVLPPTTVARPPVSPTLNVTTPDAVTVPSPTPVAITPQVPAAPFQNVPQSLKPGVVETNKVQAVTAGEAATSNSAPSSLWTQTNASPPSAWARSAPTASTTLSATAPASNLWSAPLPNAKLWNAGTATGINGTKTDWK